MSAYWVPMFCPACGKEDQQDAKDLENGLVLKCDGCDARMEPMDSGSDEDVLGMVIEGSAGDEE
jgi:hypothetical protein